MFDMKQIGDEIVGIVREYVGREVSDLNARMVMLEAQLQSIPAGERGPQGEPGVSVTAEDVLPALVDEVRSAIAALPVPVDGKDGVPGIDGKDGAPGIDGKSVTLDDIAPLINAKVAEWALDFERRAQETMQRTIDRMPVPKDGKDGRDGINGKDGRDALDLDDFSAEHDGEGNVKLRFERGDVRKDVDIRLPALVDRGVWKDGETYLRGNGVSFGGNFWIAQRDDPGKPGEGDGWRLAVRKGRDGRDSEGKKAA